MKNNKGFTLVETLISMVLLMIAVFVFTPIFAMSLKQISYAGEWQNIIVRQRAQIEEQVAKRKAILTDDTKYPPVTVTLNLYDTDPTTSDKAVTINGKIISDASGDRSYIRSFLSDIYPDETPDDEKPEIIVSPKTIYYGEDLYDTSGGKKFTVYGINLTFTADSINNITITGSNTPDNTSDYFDISYNETANIIEFTVKNTAPDNFYLNAPFIITYETYTAKITALLPQIIAVTDTGEFITGYKNNGSIIFVKGNGAISTGLVNSITYNFQKREYIAVGDSNLFSAFGESLIWENNNTTHFPSVNNNYSVSVDWLNNYMIGSSYNTTVDSTKVEVLLSVKDSTYAFKSVYTAQTGKDSVQSIDAKWFDFIRSTIFVKTYDINNNFITDGSSAFDYILALGYYGVGISDGVNTVYTYYDLLYAADSNAQWFDISNASGTPSNTSTSVVKMTGIACGVGKSIQNDGSGIKNTDFSILLACTASGKIYGVSPKSATSSMIVVGNTDWVPVNHVVTISSLNSIVYGNDIFIAVGSGTNNIMVGNVNTNESTSSAINFGINISWTGINVPGVNFNEVCFINQKFYAVGKSSDNLGVIYSSLDGLTWTKIFTTDTSCTITSIAGE